MNADCDAVFSFKVENFKRIYGPILETSLERAAELLEVALANADIMGSPVNYLAAIARFICERRS